MSTMALQLPMNYVAVETDEMEYIDGGDGIITFRVSRGVLNAAIGIGASAAVTMALAAAGITGGLSTAVIPALAGLIAAVISNGLLSQDYYSFPMYFTGLTDLALNYASGWDRKITLAM